MVAELDAAIAKHLEGLATKALPELSPKPRVRGRKPHDPKFEVRKRLYTMSGVDLTQIEGIDEIHALTLISRVGHGLHEMADGEALGELAGLVPEREEDGRAGEVEPDETGQESRGARAAADGVEPGAQPELFGRVLEASAFAAGSAFGAPGDGAQAGADRVQHEEVRAGVYEKVGGGVHGIAPRTAGKESAQAREGVRR